MRVLRQSELDREGRDEQDEYIGDKWGRYIRSTDHIYRLQQEHRGRFVDLQALAEVRRGITTNCDNFFLVTDVTDDALNRIGGDRAFLERFGVARRRVTNNSFAIIERSDGYQAAIERDYVRPIIKTARDFKCFATSRMERADLAVVLPDNRRQLSELADSYVRAAEKEGWHLSASFQNLRTRSWFCLRDASVAPLLFVKTMQYTPVVLLNDAGFLANQRLYEMHASEGVDPSAFAAALNSTVFAAERYAGVKALGREAAIDVEVFTARRFRTPDIRRLAPDHSRHLAQLMDALREREAGAMLEEALLDTTLVAAQRYIDSHPVTPDVWPAELRDNTRRDIDHVLLIALGVPAEETGDIITSVYNEMIAYTRKLRRLELEAQSNRQGGGGEITNVRNLAQDVWTQLEVEGITPRPVPDGFLQRDTATRTIRLPAGRAELVQPGLFDTEAGYSIRVGTDILRFDSVAERDYCFTLLRVGIRGDVVMPTNSNLCETLAVEIGRYVQQVGRGLAQAVSDLTGDRELQNRIVREGMRRILQS